MLSGVAASLIATGLATGAKVGQQTVVRKLRERRYSLDLGPVLTQFHKELEEAIKQEAHRRHDWDLIEITEEWDAVSTELKDIEMVYADVDQAVDAVIGTVESETEFELDDSTRSQLREIVTEKYMEAVEDFKRAVAQDDDLRGYLETELSIQARARLQDLEGRLEDFLDEIGPPSRLVHYESSAVDDAVNDLLPPNPVPYVPRSDLNEVPDTNQLLLVGPAGAGKTRALAALVRQRGREVAHVVQPKDLTQPQDTYAFERRAYDGDVLLVWDDIHRINENQEIAVFEDVVTKFRRTLDEQGYDFHLLAAARSGELDRLGESVQAVRTIRRRKGGLWGPVAPFELEPLSPGKLKKIGRRMAE